MAQQQKSNSLDQMNQVLDVYGFGGMALVAVGVWLNGKQTVLSLCVSRSKADVNWRELLSSLVESIDYTAWKLLSAMPT